MDICVACSVVSALACTWKMSITLVYNIYIYISYINEKKRLRKKENERQNFRILRIERIEIMLGGYVYVCACVYV